MSLYSNWQSAWKRCIKDYSIAHHCKNTNTTGNIYQALPSVLGVCVFSCFPKEDAQKLWMFEVLLS